MTAFLNVEVPRAHAVPVTPSAAPRRAGVSNAAIAAGWLIVSDGRWLGHWRTDDPAPVFRQN
jgi:hypothetical protein